MLNFLKKIDELLDKKIPLLILLLLLILLRFPNLFEPYWYGDEAIYLTVGQGIKYGRGLYGGIVDHKTPIIYYLATVPSQVWFRILNIVWMVASTILFYRLAKKILTKQKLVWFSSLVFILLTTLPFFEGNIPNGELFVMGFILAGANILMKTNYFDWLIKGNKVKPGNNRPLFISGIFFGLGILTKVPALLDLAAFMSIGWFYFTHQVFFKKENLWKNFKLILRKFVWLGLGVATPILISIIYFVIQGLGRDYLQYGLLYNFHYTSSWQVNIQPSWLTIFFDLKAKLIILALSFISITIGHKILKQKFKFLFGWLILTLFAATLSNRPYPHYYQQLVPAFSLLTGYIIARLINLLKKEKRTLTTLIESSLFVVTIAFIIKLSLLLNFHPYPTISYYRNFYQYISGQIDKKDYYQRFNPMMRDTYQAASYIQKTGEKEIFIWGTNPMLYALSKTIPVGKFTVSFHIKDVKAYDETLESIKQVKPKIIVVMNDEHGQFDRFYAYLKKHYHLENEYQNMDLYLRTNYE